MVLVLSAVEESPSLKPTPLEISLWGHVQGQPGRLADLALCGKGLWASSPSPTSCAFRSLLKSRVMSLRCGDEDGLKWKMTQTNAPQCGGFEGPPVSEDSS